MRFKRLVDHNAFDPTESANLSHHPLRHHPKAIEDVVDAHVGEDLLQDQVRQPVEVKRGIFGTISVARRNVAVDDEEPTVWHAWLSGKLRDLHAGH
jgi:hypothetical protein